MKLYDAKISGNCYKVRLLLSFLQLNYQKINVDFLQKENKSAAFLAINPLGQIPVLDDRGLLIHDSHAILCYLAHQYDDQKYWFPPDTPRMVKTLEWLFFSNQIIASSLSAARAFYIVHRKTVNIELATQQSYNALNHLEQQLEKTPWLVGKTVTIADIACYPYVFMAEQGKIKLDAYPYIKAWLQRFQALPHFIKMDESYTL